MSDAGGHGPSRREVLAALGAAGGWCAGWPPFPALARSGPRFHGLSIFGDLALRADFPHLPYVNPEAPKAGRLVFQPGWTRYNQNTATFNTFNGFVLKGDAVPMQDLLHDSLMARNLDEPDAVYGLLAESVEIGDVVGSYRFHLRPEARFHDGTPLTADDVVFSLVTLKEKGHPNIRALLREVDHIAADDPAIVSLRFREGASRSAPVDVVQLPIFSRAFFGNRAFEAATMEPILGCGPYRIGAFEAGRYVEFERVADYWGADLPVRRGQHNLDVIRLEFYRDRQVAFEAFKKGDLTFREENTARIWATGYDFPAVSEGRIRRETFADDRPSGAQGFFLNLRRNTLQDIRVRQALDLAFDFEWSNSNLFFGAYRRTRSIFENAPLMAEGLPSEAERALLEPWRADLPPAVFDAPYLSPVSDGSGRDRSLMLRADALLSEAGWVREGKHRLNAAGETLSFEFLAGSDAFKHIILPYIATLERLGVAASFRVVDPVQYQQRLKTFDFDITTMRYAFSSTPGRELRQFFGSEAAHQQGSDNLTGLSSPAIDALLDAIEQAPTREALTTAARALDRVLRASHLWVPQWFKGAHTVAFWDMYGYPDAKPRYGFPVESTWWFDPDKAAAIGKGD